MNVNSISNVMPPTVKTESILEVREPTQQIRDVQQNAQQTNPILENHLLAKEKDPDESELVPLSKDNQDKLKSMVSMLNEMLKRQNSHLRIFVHEASKRYGVKIIDNKTNDVIKQVPIQELLDLYGRIREMIGLLVDETR